MQQSSDNEQKLQQVRELFADAPKGFETVLHGALREMEAAPKAETRKKRRPGRQASRQSLGADHLLPVRNGEAPRLRKLFELIGGDFAGAALVGTVHDMRFALLDNDTKLLFATAYDGEWDAYVDDFATKIPNILDVLFYFIDGWPGIRSPSIKDFVLKHEVTMDAWYVASPNLTVVETRRLERIGKAVDEFLDKISE